MGPNESCYRNKMGFDYDDFYLTCAEAAMLWKHPVFSGTVGNRETIPRVGLLEFVPRFERLRRNNKRDRRASNGPPLPQRRGSR